MPSFDLPGKDFRSCSSQKTRARESTGGPMSRDSLFFARGAGYNECRLETIHPRDHSRILIRTNPDAAKDKGDIPSPAVEQPAGCMIRLAYCNMQPGDCIWIPPRPIASRSRCCCARLARGCGTL